jgi:hypothetical protein
VGKEYVALTIVREPLKLAHVGEVRAHVTGVAIAGLPIVKVTDPSLTVACDGTVGAI